MNNDYLSYELLMLMELLRANQGTFSLDETGHWYAIIGKQEYLGFNWDIENFRNAYSFLINRLPTFPEESVHNDD